MLGSIVRNLREITEIEQNMEHAKALFNELTKVIVAYRNYSVK